MYIRHAFIQIAFLSLLLTTQIALAQDKPLFYAAFEGNTNAVAVGRGEGQLKGIATYETGYSGKGIRLAPGAQLSYLLDKNMNIKSGTVMFWFKPEWEKNGDGRFWFFDNGVIDFYRFKGETSGLLQVRVRGNGKILLSKQVADLETGVWSHMALTWDEKDGIYLYINGEAKISEKATWKGKLPAWKKRFNIFSHIKPGVPEGKTGIIDQYSIYGRTLSQDDILAASMTPPTSAPAKKKPIFVASFEGNTQAHRGTTDLLGIVGGHVSYESGAAGMGVVLRRYAYDQKSSLTYALGKLPKQGTLSFFFQPLWSATDGKRHELLQFSSTDKTISLAMNAKGVMQLRFADGGTEILRTPLPLQKNNRHHIVIQWDSEAKNYSLTLDKKTYKGTLTKVNKSFFSGQWSLCLGAFTADNYTGDSSEGIFDELAIYDGIIDPASLGRIQGTLGGQSVIRIQPNVKRGSISFQIPSLQKHLIFNLSGTRQNQFPHPVSEAKLNTYVAVSQPQSPIGSLAFWGYLNSKPQKQRTLVKITTATASYRFTYDPKTKRAGVVIREGDAVKIIRSIYLIQPNEWNLYALSWEAGVLSFHINGTWQGEIAFAPPTATWESLLLSSNDKIADLSAWDQPLGGASQISLFNYGVGKTYEPHASSPHERKLWDLDTADRIHSKTREKICLSGLWRFQPSEKNNLVPPAQKKHYYSRIPGRWLSKSYYSIFDVHGKRLPEINGKEPNQLFKGWYTRQIEIPKDFRGQRIYLTTNYMGANAARVYVNNQLVKTFAQRHRNAQGEVRRVYADLSAFNQETSIKVDVFLYFNKYFDRWAAADVSLLDIALEKRGSVFSKATRLRTSVSSKQMQILTTLVNPLRTPHRVKIVARIYDQAGELVHTSDAKSVTLSNRAQQDVDFTFDWLAPQTWSHETPTLYTFRLQISDEADQLLDESYAQAFGFREFAIDGSNFKLNGKKLHLFYCSSSDGLWDRYSSFYGANRKEAFAAVRALKENGYNTLGIKFIWRADGPSLGRTPHYQKNILDAADALGMYVVLWAPPLDQFTDRTRYRQAIRDFVTAWGNHPSVIFYLTTFNTTGYQWAEEPSMVDNLTYVPTHRKQARDLALESDAIIRSIDPTRELYHNCSGNLTNLYTTMHYMSFGLPLQEREDWPSRWNATRKTAFMASELGFPFFGQFYDFDFPIRGGIMLFAENAARYLGDKAYQLVKASAPMQKGGDYGCFLKDGTLRPEFLAIKSLFTKRHLRAWRGYGVSGTGIFAETTSSFERNFTNFTMPTSYNNLKTWGIKPDLMHMEHRFHYMDKPTAYFQVMKKALTPILVMVGGHVGEFNEKDHAYFSGETINKQAIVINDTMQLLPVDITMQLQDDAGASIQIKKTTTTIKPGHTYKWPVHFTAPIHTDRSEYRIHLRVKRAGTLVGEDEFAIQIFPRQAVKPISQLGLYDPKGMTKVLLQKAGITAMQVRTVDDLDGLRGLIIGREALGKISDPLLKAIEDKGRIARGLRILIFEQTESNLGNLIFEATSQRYVFIRDAAHPVLAGLQGKDFINWRGTSDLIEAYSTPSPESETGPHYPHAKWKWGNGGIVASWVIRKPQYAAFRPILDSGYDLTNSPLLEYSRGQGRVIMCQLDVTKRYGVDPVATRITNNLLRYLDAPLPAAPRKTAYLGADNAIWKTLTAGRTDCVRIKTPSQANGYDVLILSPDSPGTLDKHKQTIGQFVKRGGSVLYFHPGKADVASLSWLPLSVPVESKSTFNAQFTENSSILLRGLGSGDFYWRTDKMIHIFNTKTTLTQPAVIATAEYGKGQFVFCGIDPTQFAPKAYKYKGKKPYVSFADKEVEQKSIRIVNVLLQNVGVSLPGGSLFGNRHYMDNQKNQNNIAIKLSKWKFKIDPTNAGVRQSWATVDLDNTWKPIFVPKEWEAQGYNMVTDNTVTTFKSKGKNTHPYDGYAWYRTSIFIPKTWKKAKLILQIGAVDDLDWAYCNGKPIGHTGKDTPEYWIAKRTYTIPNEYLRFGEKNTLAIRVLDLRGSGGITRGPVQIQVQNASGVRATNDPSPYVKNLSRYDMNAFHKW